jgi:hypothetical protein
VARLKGEGSVRFARALFFRVEREAGLIQFIIGEGNQAKQTANLVRKESQVPMILHLALQLGCPIPSVSGHTLPANRKSNENS